MGERPRQRGGVGALWRAASRARLEPHRGPAAARRPALGHHPSTVAPGARGGLLQPERSRVPLGPPRAGRRARDRVPAAARPSRQGGASGGAGRRGAARRRLCLRGHRRRGIEVCRHTAGHGFETCRVALPMRAKTLAGACSRGNQCRACAHKSPPRRRRRRRPRRHHPPSLRRHRRQLQQVLLQQRPSPPRSQRPSRVAASSLT